MSDERRWDAARGTVEVLTWKDGLLARLAHDLLLRAERFEVVVRDGQVRVEVPADALRVVGVRDGDRVTPVSPADAADIEENARDKVLVAARHRAIVFQAPAAEGATLAGELELHGVRRPLTVPVTRAAGRLTGQVELVPSRWGIEPYKALMGAIKLQDRVLVRFDLPDDQPG